MDLFHTFTIDYSWINVCCFSPDYWDTNVLFYVIILLFWSPDAGQ
jgi:hypothetical protein